MNNKNGFTLVELLGTIAILAIIAGIAFPAVQTTIRKNRENTYVEQINSIINATDKFVVGESLDVDESLVAGELDGKIIYGMQPAVLIRNGYLKDNGSIKDPITGDILKGCILIKWSGTTNQYLIKYYNLDSEHDGKNYTTKINSYYDESTDNWWDPSEKTINNSCILVDNE